MSDAPEHHDDLPDEDEADAPEAPLMDELTQEMDPDELAALDGDDFEDEDDDDESFAAADYGRADGEATAEDEPDPEPLGSEELAALVADVAARDPDELEDDEAEPAEPSDDLARTRISSLEMPTPSDSELSIAGNGDSELADSELADSEAGDTDSAAGGTDSDAGGTDSEQAAARPAKEHDTDSFRRAMWVPTAPPHLREEGEDTDAIDTEVYPRIPSPASSQQADAEALRQAYDCLEIRTPIQELESYARARLETLARLGEAQQAETTLAAMQLGLNALCHVMGAAPKELP